MYYAVDVIRWCIALKCEALMRLTYQRDYLPEREAWRDFLVCKRNHRTLGSIEACVVQKPMCADYRADSNSERLEK